MTRTAPHAHVLLRQAGAVLVLAAAFLLGAPAAQAHDVLEASNPTDSATVQSVPASVVLTFDHTPIGVGTEVLVKDATGANQSEGPAKIVDNNVTQPLKPGAPAGAYTVVWRVVSSDSHPIEGTFTFTSKATASPPATASQGGESAGTASGTTTISPVAGYAGAPGPVWLIVAFVAVVVIVALGILVRRALAGAREE
ncbi:copper resistance protein CopC [Sinomonas flava]|uniref:copper resistance CopC family protein n=1 Tax=Sinomonas flava TaxID=496857 RepID=UPI0039A767CB